MHDLQYVTKLCDCSKLVVLMTAKLGISIVKTMEYGLCVCVWTSMGAYEWKSIHLTDRSVLKFKILYLLVL